MNVINNLGQYQQYQLGQSIPVAAANPAGGLAGAGVGLGLGAAIAGRMMPGTGGAPWPGGGGAPTPPTPSASWYFAENRETRGPLTMAQLGEAIAAGRVSRATLVWTGGMTGWMPAGEVPEIAALLQAQTPPPPPLPPQG
jgi:hypothetical protein